MADLFLVNTPEWATVIKGIIRAEMARYSVSYAELSKRLSERFNITQSGNNLKAKVNKGVLGSQLFIQILIVLNVKNLDLIEVEHHFQTIAGSADTETGDG